MNIPVDPFRVYEDDGVGRGDIHTYAIDQNAGNRILKRGRTHKSHNILSKPP